MYETLPRELRNHVIQIMRKDLFLRRIQDFEEKFKTITPPELTRFGVRYEAGEYNIEKHLYRISGVPFWEVWRIYHFSEFYGWKGKMVGHCVMTEDYVKMRKHSGPIV